MLNVYSTEKRAKAPLDPLEPGKIKMYVCGPTVYDHCHVGHARPAVVFDTIRRYLEYSGFAVTFVSNITDVDDKIINRANALGISCKALTARYQDEYEADMAALGVRSPTIRPKATEHIPEMIALIQTLMDKGVAYVTSRGVWFDVSKFPGYGRLSGKVADDENTEHRVETDPEKRHAQDFALWKFAKPGEPEWPSPWGAGRPGWHIECSAMSGKYCAMQLDIHGGGADLVFPHHENELAQSEAATGKTFARCWVHNGFITVAKDDGEEAKMGKSKGNAFWLREAFKLCGPAAIRFWILGTHYRMPLLYKPELLESAKNSLDRLYTCLEGLAKIDAPAPLAAWNSATTAERLQLAPGEGLAGAAVAAGQKFIVAMDDDFNTPQALSALFELVNAANSGLAAKAEPAQLAAAREILYEFLGVLGLPLTRPDTGSASADKYLQILVDLRNEARQKKDFATSDAIRDRLAAAGVELKDQAGKTTWTVK
ncbi:MAG: cysteine--tRNA ligase [Planctomycetes bacterium]|nr:cysteine--tRNA ligase [Planctomycetota bacterium]